MTFTLISAVSQNNVIGKDGRLPWHNIKEDMERFKKLTLNHPVIMGRKTFESLPAKFRPLPERQNVVISRNKSYNPGKHSNLYIVHSIDEAIETVSMFNADVAYVTGGQSIYEAFMPLADRMEITRIYRDYPGDASFPEIDSREWNLTGEEKHETNDGIPFSFMSYVRL